MWSVNKVIKEATETSTGVVEQLCTKCGLDRMTTTPKKVAPTPASGCASEIALSQTTLTALVMVAFCVVKKKYL